MTELTLERCVHKLSIADIREAGLGGSITEVRFRNRETTLERSLYTGKVAKPSSHMRRLLDTL